MLSLQIWPAALFFLLFMVQYWACSCHFLFDHSERWNMGHWEEWRALLSAFVKWTQYYMCSVFNFSVISSWTFSWQWKCSHLCHLFPVTCNLWTLQLHLVPANGIALGTVFHAESNYVFTVSSKKKTCASQGLVFGAIRLLWDNGFVDHDMQNLRDISFKIYASSVSIDPTD